MSEASDADLMVQTRSGDRQAFSRLVDRHKDGVVRALTRVCGSHAQAEDLAQEVFISLFHDAQRYQERGQLRSYLLRLGVNRLRSEYRREQRRALLRALWLPSGNGGPPTAPEPEQLVGESQRQLTAALEGLPLTFRVPLVLHVVEGLPYDEIAQVVGCRVGTVKSRIHRGREQLRRSLEPYFGERT